MSPWGRLPLAASAGVALVLLVVLTGPGWICFPVLPDLRQRRMLQLLGTLVEWVGNL